MHAYRQSPYPLLTVDYCLEKVLEFTNTKEPICIELRVWDVFALYIFSYVHFCITN